MAKKTTRKEGSRRKRRSPEEIIADLQKQIREVKDRARSKELKQSGGVRFALAAVRALDKALNAAAEEDATPLRHALADSRKPIADYLTTEGIRLPRARLPKGPRPKKA